MRFFISMVMLFAIAGLGVSVSDRPANATPRLGNTDFVFYKGSPAANDLAMTDAGGHVFNLSDLRGRVVILNFWRKNCRYCAQEKKYLTRLVRKAKLDDLKVVCVNLWDDARVIRKLGKSLDPGLTLVGGVSGRQNTIENVMNGRLMGYYVVNGDREAIYEIKGFPTSYVIDKEGRVVASHMGMARWDKPAVVKWMTDLAAENQDIGPAQNQESDLPEWLDRLLTASSAGRGRAVEAGLSNGRSQAPRSLSRRVQ